jgi:hypothetical protein
MRRDGPRRQLAERFVIGSRTATSAPAPSAGRERSRDTALERVTRHFLHLLLDPLQRRALALADLDGEELQRCR